jgi:homoserine dehydrogenase
MKRILRSIVTVVCIVALFAAGFAAGTWNANRKNGSLVSSATIQTQISSLSELATAKLDYRGIVRYESGDIAFINKKGFTMLYTAEVKAGVDLSQASVDVSGRTITVTLPQASVQSCDIDASSLTFYDQSYAIFNWENKEDAQKALELAQSDAAEKVDETTLVDAANKQAADVVSSMLSSFTQGSDPYTLDIRQA